MQVSSLLFILVSAWVGIDAAASSSASIFDERELQHIAETQGYGYKTANLQLLQRVCETFNATKPALKIAVPPFVGIPSAAVQAKVGLDLRALWAPVVAVMGDQTTALTKKQFADGFDGAQEAFMTQLARAWPVLATEDIRLNDYFGIKGVDELLAAVAARGNRLMVRSTGKEDTKAFANAGGNQSVANVEPNPVAVLAAMGTVVKSYFGTKSLSQRLGLGDESVFSNQIFIPVLIQEMIAEKEEIPRCGVMFTEEPEGHIEQVAAVGGAGSADTSVYATSGITLIQAAYGHNEGVVNSLIPVDTYYAMQLPGQSQPAIYPVVRSKTARLVPGAGGMQRVENAKGMRLSRVLTDQELYTLKTLADQLERFYGYAVDIEFVIKGKTIYLVQARPLVHKISDVPPSYVRDGIRGQRFLGSTIVAAGGGVRALTAANQVVIAPTIGAALDYYLHDATCTPAEVRAIIVGTMAPSTSHEATTFRNEGKPVMYLPDITVIEEQLKAGKPLFFSPQQNMVIAMDEVVDSDIIQGWISYPVPATLSVLPKLFGRCGNGSLMLPDIEVHSSQKTSKKRKKTDPAPLAPWSILLGHMKNGDNATVKKAVSQFLAKWHAIEIKYAKDEALEADAGALIQGIIRLCMQVVAMADITHDSPQYLKRLLPIRMLESLVYQQENRADVLLPLSIATISKTLVQEHAITATAPAVAIAVKNYYVQLQKVHEVMYAEPVHEAWNQLLAALAVMPTGGPIAFFASFVAQLSTLGILPAWLHTIFFQDIQTLGITAIEELLKKWQGDIATDKAFLALMGAMQMRCKGIDLNAFAAPRSCAAAWKSFNEEIVAYFSGSFLDAFKAAGALGKMAAIQTMHTLVMTFDEVIKSMKGSRLLNNDKKLPLFQVMLQANFCLLQAWVALVPDQAMLGAWLASVDEYFAMMKAIVNKSFEPSDLFPTEGLSTFVFTMGSGHNWVSDVESNIQPETGEDVFSIMHQSLLACCRALNVPYLSIVEKPFLVSEIEKVLLPSTGGLVCRPLGFIMGNAGQTFFYNIPLGAHSCQIELHCNNKNKRAEINLNFCGGADEEVFRWIGIAIVALVKKEHAKNLDSPFIAVRIKKLTYQLLEMLLVMETGDEIKQFALLWDDFMSIAEEDTFSYDDPVFHDVAIDVKSILDSLPCSAEIRKKAEKLIYFKQAECIQFFPQPERDRWAQQAIVYATSRKNIITTLQLFTLLVEAGYGYAPAILAAQCNMSNPNMLVRVQVLQLFEKLVARGNGCEEALRAIMENLGNKDEQIQFHVVTLCKALVVQGRYHWSAIWVASKIIDSDNDSIRLQALALFRELLVRGDGYAQAVTAVRQLREKGMIGDANELAQYLSEIYRAPGS